MFKIFYRTYDVTWHAYPAWLWIVIESHFGVICASVPALKIFFTKYFDVSQITRSLGSSWQLQSDKSDQNKMPQDEKSKQNFFVVDTTNIDSTYQPSNDTYNADTDFEIELGNIGGIAVTRAWDAESAYDSDRKHPGPALSSHSSQLPLKREGGGPQSPEKKCKAEDGTWLEDNSNPSTPSSLSEMRQ